jgi:hypothetical protein
MLRSEALAEFLDDWEAEHGAFTEEELAEASRKLGLPTPQTRDQATERSPR